MSRCCHKRNPFLFWKIRCPAKKPEWTSPNVNQLTLCETYMWRMTHLFLIIIWQISSNSTMNALENFSFQLDRNEFWITIVSKSWAIGRFLAYNSKQTIKQCATDWFLITSAFCFYNVTIVAFAFIIYNVTILYIITWGFFVWAHNNGHLKFSLSCNLFMK